MTKYSAETCGLPALDQLRGEFLRAAREESRSRRRARLRAVAVALAGALVVTLAALAVGGGETPGSPATPARAASGAGTTAALSDDSSWWQPGWRTIDDAVEAGVLVPDRGSYSEAAEVDFAMEGPVTSFAEDCRRTYPPDELTTTEQLGTAALHCKATIAITEGRLPPGEYSDEGLRQALRE